MDVNSAMVVDFSCTVPLVDCKKESIGKGKRHYAMIEDGSAGGCTLKSEELSPALENPNKLLCSRKLETNVGGKSIRDCDVTSTCDMTQSSMINRQKKYSQLLSLNHGLSVKSSTLEDSGLGLFTNQAIRKGDVFTWVDGQVVPISLDEKKQLFKGDFKAISHTVSIDSHTVVHAYKEPAEYLGGGGFSNDGFTTHKGNNAEFLKDSDGKNIYLRATENIGENEEVFCSYDKDYWQRFSEFYPESYKKIIKKLIYKKVCSYLSRADFKGVDEQEEKKSLKYVFSFSNLGEWKFLPSDIECDEYRVRLLKKIRSLDIGSEEYVKWLGHYVATSDGYVDFMAAFFNGTDTSEFVSLPKFFLNKSNKWEQCHIHTLLKLQGEECTLTVKEMKSVIKCLNPDFPDYKRLLIEFLYMICLDSGFTGEEFTWDPDNPSGRLFAEKVKRLFKGVDCPRSMQSELSGNKLSRGDSAWADKKLYDLFEALHTEGIGCSAQNTSKRFYVIRPGYYNEEMVKVKLKAIPEKTLKEEDTLETIDSMVTFLNNMFKNGYNGLSSELADRCFMDELRFNKYRQHCGIMVSMSKLTVGAVLSKRFSFSNQDLGNLSECSSDVEMSDAVKEVAGVCYNKGFINDLESLLSSREFVLNRKNSAAVVECLLDLYQKCMFIEKHLNKIDMFRQRQIEDRMSVAPIASNNAEITGLLNLID